MIDFLPDALLMLIAEFFDARTILCVIIQLSKRWYRLSWEIQIRGNLQLSSNQTKLLLLKFPVLKSKKLYYSTARYSRKVKAINDLIRANSTQKIDSCKYYLSYANVIAYRFRHLEGVEIVLSYQPKLRKQLLYFAFHVLPPSLRLLKISVPNLDSITWMESSETRNLSFAANSSVRSSHISHQMFSISSHRLSRRGSDSESCRTKINHIPFNSNKGYSGQCHHPNFNTPIHSRNSENLLTDEETSRCSENFQRQTVHSNCRNYDCSKCHSVNNHSDGSNLNFTPNQNNQRNIAQVEKFKSNQAKSKIPISKQKIGNNSFENNLSICQTNKSNDSPVLLNRNVSNFHNPNAQFLKAELFSEKDCPEKFDSNSDSSAQSAHSEEIDSIAQSLFVNDDVSLRLQPTDSGAENSSIITHKSRGANSITESHDNKIHQSSHNSYDIDNDSYENLWLEAKDWKYILERFSKIETLQISVSMQVAFGVFQIMEFELPDTLKKLNQKSDDILRHLLRLTVSGITSDAFRINPNCILPSLKILELGFVEVNIGHHDIRPFFDLQQLNKLYENDPSKTKIVSHPLNRLALYTDDDEDEQLRLALLLNRLVNQIGEETISIPERIPRQPNRNEAVSHQCNNMSIKLPYLRTLQVPRLSLLSPNFPSVAPGIRQLLSYENWEFSSAVSGQHELLTDRSENSTLHGLNSNDVLQLYQPAIINCDTPIDFQLIINNNTCQNTCPIADLPLPQTIQPTSLTCSSNDEIINACKSHNAESMLQENYQSTAPYISARTSLTTNLPFDCDNATPIQENIHSAINQSESSQIKHMRAKHASLTLNGFPNNNESKLSRNSSSIGNLKNFQISESSNIASYPCKSTQKNKNTCINKIDHSSSYHACCNTPSILSKQNRSACSSVSNNAVYVLNRKFSQQSLMTNVFTRQDTFSDRPDATSATLTTDMRQPYGNTNDIIMKSRGTHKRSSLDIGGKGCANDREDKKLDLISNTSPRIPNILRNSINLYDSTHQNKLNSNFKQKSMDFKNKRNLHINNISKISIPEDLNKLVHQDNLSSNKTTDQSEKTTFPIHSIAQPFQLSPPITFPEENGRNLLNYTHTTKNRAESFASYNDFDKLEEDLSNQYIREREISTNNTVFVSVRRTPSIIRLQQLIQNLPKLKRISFYRSFEIYKLAGLRELILSFNFFEGDVIARCDHGCVAYEFKSSVSKQQHQYNLNSPILNPRYSEKVLVCRTNRNNCDIHHFTLENSNVSKVLDPVLSPPKTNYTMYNLEISSGIHLKLFFIPL